jgi:hypothetical protein
MSAEQQFSTLDKGLLGTVATTGTVAVSFMQTFEVYLRVAGLAIGLAIGVVTLLSVIRDYRRKS